MKGLTEAIILLAFLLFGSLVILGFTVWYRLSQYKKSSYCAVTKRSYWSVINEKGSAGEYWLYRKLCYRERMGERFLFNVYLPKENGETTELDMLLLTKKGIFVFESKNYSGWIFGNASDRYWTQTLRTGNGVQKNRFYNPILQNKNHALRLAEILGVEIPVYSIIVFSDRCNLENVQVGDEAVCVANRSVLSRVLRENWASLPDCFSDAEDVRRLEEFLYPYSQTTEEERRAHVEHVKRDQAYAELAREEICPRCGSALKVRTVSSGARAGARFLGCASYPRCRYTRNLE